MDEEDETHLSDFEAYLDEDDDGGATAAAAAGDAGGGPAAASAAALPAATAAGAVDAVTAKARRPCHSALQPSLWAAESVSGMTSHYMLSP